jgi:hypothetical protein
MGQMATLKVYHTVPLKDHLVLLNPRCDHPLRLLFPLPPVPNRLVLLSILSISTQNKIDIASTSKAVVVVWSLD